MSINQRKHNPTRHLSIGVIDEKAVNDAFEKAEATHKIQFGESAFMMAKKQQSESDKKKLWQKYTVTIKEKQFIQKQIDQILGASKEEIDEMKLLKHEIDLEFAAAQEQEELELIRDLEKQQAAQLASGLGSGMQSLDESQINQEGADQEEQQMVIDDKYAKPDTRITALMQGLDSNSLEDVQIPREETKQTNKYSQVSRGRSRATSYYQDSNDGNQKKAQQMLPPLEQSRVNESLNLRKSYTGSVASVTSSVRARMSQNEINKKMRTLDNKAEDRAEGNVHFYGESKVTASQDNVKKMKVKHKVQKEPTGPSIEAGVFFEIEETGKKQKKNVAFMDDVEKMREENALFVTVDPEADSDKSEGDEVLQLRIVENLKKQNANLNIISEFQRLKKSYKRYRLKHCLGQFKDVSDSIKKQFDQFRDQDNINQFSREYDAEERRKRVKNGNDNIQLVLRNEIIQRLREERNKLDKINAEKMMKEAAIEKKKEEDRKRMMEENRVRLSEQLSAINEAAEEDMMNSDARQFEQEKKEMQEDMDKDLNDQENASEGLKSDSDDDVILGKLTSFAEIKKYKMKLELAKNKLKAKQATKEVDKLSYFKRVEGFHDISLKNLLRAKFLKQLHKLKKEENKEKAIEEGQKLEDLEFSDDSGFSEGLLHLVDGFEGDIEHVELHDLAGGSFDLAAGEDICRECGQRIGTYSESSHYATSPNQSGNVSRNVTANNSRAGIPQQRTNESKKSTSKKKSQSVPKKQQKKQTRADQIQQLKQEQLTFKASQDEYPEIQIPTEFATKFEVDHSLQPGQVWYEPRHVQDELRIRYLQKEYQEFESHHKRELKEQEIKLRQKIHSYVKICLNNIEKSLRDQYRFVYVQVEKTVDKERLLKKMIFDLKKKVKTQEDIVRDMTAFGRWEYFAHQEFTQQLEKKGMTKIDGTDQEVKDLRKKNEVGYEQFYRSLENLSVIEQDNPDLTRPFQLYSSRIRLTCFERLNLMERETVRHYQKKLSSKTDEIDQARAERDAQFQFLEVLEIEKANLNTQVAELKVQLQTTIEKWNIDKRQRDKLLKETIQEYQYRHDCFTADVQQLQEIFEKELFVKDNIISQTEKLNKACGEKIRRLMFKLQTPREHLQFLEKNGALEEFISAKILGQEATAKWLLMDNAKPELDRLEKGVQQKFKELKARGIETNYDTTLKACQRNVPTEEPAVYLSSTYTRNIHDEFNGQVKDFKFKELPMGYKPNLLGKYSAPNNDSFVDDSAKKDFASFLQVSSYQNNQDTARATIQQSNEKDNSLIKVHNYSNLYENDQDIAFSSIMNANDQEKTLLENASLIQSLLSTDQQEQNTIKIRRKEVEKSKKTGFGISIRGSNFGLISEDMSGFFTARQARDEHLAISRQMGSQFLADLNNDNPIQAKAITAQPGSRPKPRAHRLRLNERLVRNMANKDESNLGSQTLRHSQQTNRLKSDKTSDPGSPQGLFGTLMNPRDSELLPSKYNSKLNMTKAQLQSQKEITAHIFSEKKFKGGHFSKSKPTNVLSPKTLHNPVSSTQLSPSFDKARLQSETTVSLQKNLKPSIKRNAQLSVPENLFNDKHLIISKIGVNSESTKQPVILQGPGIDYNKKTLDLRNKRPAQKSSEKQTIDANETDNSRNHFSEEMIQQLAVKTGSNSKTAGMYKIDRRKRSLMNQDLATSKDQDH